MENVDILNQILVELKGLKDGQEALKECVSSLQSNVSLINNSISMLEHQSKKIEVCIENEFNEKFNALFEGHALINEKLDSLKTVANDVATSVSAVEIASKLNCHEIAMLKERVGIY